MAPCKPIVPRGVIAASGDWMHHEGKGATHPAEQQVLLDGMAVRHKVVLVEQGGDDMMVDGGRRALHHSLQLLRLCEAQHPDN